MTYEEFGQGIGQPPIEQLESEVVEEPTPAEEPETPPVVEEKRTGVRYDLEKTKELNKKQAGKIVKSAFTFLFTLLIMVFLFVFGLLVGGEYGVKTEKVKLRDISFMNEFTGLLKTATAMPLSLTVSEEKMNEMLAEKKDLFAPLKNLNISLKEGVCVFSGQMKTAEIKNFFDAEIPDFIFLFFPESLNIKAEFVADEENPAQPKIKNLEILNLDYSEDIINELQPQTVIENILKENFLSAIPNRISVSSFEIREGKLICRGNLRLIE